MDYSLLQEVYDEIISMFQEIRDSLNSTLDYIKQLFGEVDSLNKELACIIYTSRKKKRRLPFRAKKYRAIIIYRIDYLSGFT